ncbi:MAG: hypothetical protein BroJett018_04370 [Chloroflexota bacterium]|nr:hypothetical protein [Chloroflexota bacterium]NOG63646.1 hypothetical protein [Chloroflexota bacterium]GIK62643.1 MAG: hypothetical protein BroJett018_04370 [Chloroflexota bacterium]
MDDEFYIKLHNMLEVWVTAGFESRDEIIQSAIDSFYDVGEPDEIKALAEPLTEKFLQEHSAMQRHWNYLTDCDKLDKAFDELNRAGIIARQNFWCCQTCGHAAMDDELKKVRRARGYVFFHEQDTESAVQSGVLYLSFRSRDYQRERMVKIGHEIVGVFKRYGFDVHWDGDAKKRIGIYHLDWKRRRA